MSKNIVFCADGTWNYPSDPEDDNADGNPSNVYKLFLKLEGNLDQGSVRLADEQEKTLRASDGSVLQVAKYLHGVGDSKNFLVKVLGGTVGAGLIARIVRGYTFVSRNYAEGDKIFLVGFSRGAYTARALAGLISAKGLLPPEIADQNDKEAAYRAGSAVWFEWRSEAMLAKALPVFGLRAIVRDLPGFVSERRAFRLIQAPIEAVAVWDTVGSLGIPVFGLHGMPVDVFQFGDRRLGDNVKFARHAVSIDERRRNFEPTLWEPDSRPDRIVQVLFPGGHSDVGGGYALTGDESGLSDCTLKWMSKELTDLGVRIGPPIIPESPDPCGIGHQEWVKPLWQALGDIVRRIPDAPSLHLSEAVIQRMKAETVKVLPAGVGITDPAAYLPENIATYIKEKAGAQGVVIVPL